MEIQPLKIGTKMAKVPVIQGGMGVGISLGNLAGAVAKEGGIGIISAAQPGFKEKDFEKNPLEANLRAVKSEYEKARKLAPDGIIGFNLMVAMEHYEEYVHAVVEAGADLIELGIPFSDPTAEGPVIQEANVRALSVGTTTDKIFDMVVRIRKTVKIPLVFMTYANVVFSYGSERFISKAAQIGINGLILPDVPYEEKEEFEPICRKYGLDLISMIAPTSDHRIAMVAKEASGFIYVVSSLGVTGVRSEIKTDIGALVEQIRAVTDVPCAVGFGISEPEQAKKMAGLSDGAIVGSAVVKRIAKYGKDSVPYVAEYVREMKQAVMEA